jgi:superfamily II DNA or RNA helicase
MAKKSVSKLSTAKVLRPHQQEAFNAYITKLQTEAKFAGRFVMPTGAGKTFVEAAILDHRITNLTFGESRTHIHLVLAPRIVLVNQLIEEYRNYGGTQFRAVAFHSGHLETDYEVVKWEESSTTSVEDLKQEWKNAQLDGKHLVVFSTYHSCGRLKNIDFDTILADESQYCVGAEFNNSVRSLTGKVSLFFTATERWTPSDTGRGLNNTSVFGDRLYEVSPKTLIERGLIVAPRLHIGRIETTNEDDSIVDQVTELAVKQTELAKDMGFSKILFAMNGTKDVKTVSDNLSKIRAKMPNHSVFTITSKTGAQIDGVKMVRDDFLQKLKDCENALIFHYDILSEGIDVDGITGVVLMRNLGDAKLQQTVGRAVRVYKPNPELKKQAWISVPVLNGDDDDMTRVKDVLTALREGGWDLSKEEIFETKPNKHQGDDTDIPDAYGKYKPNLSAFTIQCVHEIEQGEFWDKIHAATNLVEELGMMEV